MLNRSSYRLHSFSTRVFLLIALMEVIPIHPLLSKGITLKVLKSSTWSLEKLDELYAFTDDSIYTCTKSQCLWTSVIPYYLSSSPSETFDPKKVGKSRKGDYLIMHYDSTNTTICYNIQEVGKKELILHQTPSKSYKNPVRLLKNNSYLYDTLQLTSSHKELICKHFRSKYQKAYFKAFPSTWYDFDRTFNHALFLNDNILTSHQDLSHEAVRYIDSFARLKTINRKRYYKKLIELTIGMPSHSTPATDYWLSVVNSKINENRKAFNATLVTETKNMQSRFWQVLRRDDEVKCTPILSKTINTVLASQTLHYDAERIYLSDSIAVYVSNCAPGLTPSIKYVGPYVITDSVNNNLINKKNSIILTPQETKKGNIFSLNMKDGENIFAISKRLFKKKAQNLTTDSLLMAVSFRELEQKTTLQKEMQQLFFESFPDTWCEFYALLISDEYGNRGFHNKTNDYIDKFGNLYLISAHDLLAKCINISIDALIEDPTAQMWQKIVKGIVKKNPDELNIVLQYYSPRQRESFMQFLHYE